MHDDVGTTLFGDGGRGGQRGWAFATYLAESSAEVSAERSRRLATLTKKKARGQKSREQEENKKEFNSRKYILEILHSQVFRLTLHVIVVLYCSLDSH